MLGLAFHDLRDQPAIGGGQFAVERVDAGFEGAQAAVGAARAAITQNQIAAKGESISKAIDIISNGLKASLDEEKGGDLAGRLGSLYDYMVLRLLQANLKNDDKALEEVAGLISELHSAWREISPAKQAAA